MTRRITVEISCFSPPFTMEIFVPEGSDAEEYIDEFLDTILADNFRYNCDWEFE